MARKGSSPSEHAIYVISVAAELAGVHPQTLRVYERKGLVNPQRTAGNTRRYTERDILLLRRIQELTTEGVNLAGVERILELEDTIERMRSIQEQLAAELERIEAHINELLETRNSMALVPLKDVRRVRRALKSDAIDAAGRRRIFTVGPASETDEEG
jgi:MerR family transcriptional regulator/heat shock protein HspR